MAWTFSHYSNSSRDKVTGEMVSKLNSLTDLELQSAKVTIAKARDDDYDGFIYYYANATSAPKPPVGPDFSTSAWSHDSNAASEVNNFRNGTPDGNGVTLDASQAWYADVTAYHEKGDPTAFVVWFRSNKK